MALSRLDFRITPQMKVAAYLRVSTKDKGQDPFNQAPSIKQLAERRGWDIEHQYVDYDTGGKASRAQFEHMMEDARQGKISLLIFWSLDRFSREGIAETLNHLKRLSSYGVDFLSVQEPMLETVGPTKELLIAILAYFAAFERERHRQRVLAGIERAKAQGVKFGRKQAKIDEASLKKMMIDKWSIRQMAKALGVGVGSVHRRICRIQAAEALEKLGLGDEGDGI